MTNNILKKTLAVLWWMTCFFLTIDTGLFLYPSLSQTLLGGTCTLLTCTTIMIYGIVYKGKWPTNKGILLVMSWGVYIVFHSCFVENAEHYKMYYILTSLTLLLSLSFALHNDYISQRQIENGLLFMTVLQIACMILQLVGIKESNNPNFTCTGFGTNPNTVGAHPVCARGPMWASAPTNSKPMQCPNTHTRRAGACFRRTDCTAVTKRAHTPVRPYGV